LLGRSAPATRPRCAGVTPCMPCSFGLILHRRSRTGGPVRDLLRVTVTVRWIPLVTAAYGTRVARPARTTTFAPGGDGSQLAQTVRPFLGDYRLVGKSPEGLAAAGWETWTLDSPGVGPPGCDWVGGVTLGLLGLVIIGRAALLPGAGSSCVQRVPFNYAPDQREAGPHVRRRRPHRLEHCT
jgi:hypothetical protein